MENQKRLKKETIWWAKAKKTREEAELAEIELWLASMMEGEVLGFLTKGSKAALVQKEKLRKEILADREELWRLKSRSIWLSSGDENTNFFHAYVKGRKVHNTIWEMRDDRAYKASSFDELSSMGFNHFKSIFTA